MDQPTLESEAIDTEPLRDEDLVAVEVRIHGSEEISCEIEGFGDAEASVAIYCSICLCAK